MSPGAQSDDKEKIIKENINLKSHNFNEATTKIARLLLVGQVGSLPSGGQLTDSKIGHTLSPSSTSSGGQKFIFLCSERDRQNLFQDYDEIWE